MLREHVRTSSTSHLGDQRKRSYRCGVISRFMIVEVKYVGADDIAWRVGWRGESSAERGGRGSQANVS